MRLLPRPRSAVLLLAAVLAACAGAPGAGGAGGRNAPKDRDGILPRTASSEHDAQFFRLQSLVAQWDAAQADGNERDAAAFAAKAREEVDKDLPTFAAASRGDFGVKAQYVAVQGLGFSASPEATGFLVDRLGGNDPRLVGNALIGLKIRSDPATPLPPVLALLRVPADEPRRFAPLALANVLVARERAGIPLESAYGDEAEASLVALVRDQDPAVRLHVAKALGALKRPATNDFLVILLGDDHVRIRLAAAAALERIGDPRAFPKVVDLLDSIEADAKPVVRDVLVSYAERVRGSPLTPAEISSLGTDRHAWDRWFGANQRSPRSGG